MAELRYLSPAKVNLSLQVREADDNGYHPLRSVVQALEWHDVLELDAGDDDSLVVEGPELPEEGENLVWKAVSVLDVRRPALAFRLFKEIPVSAGLGGGSSNAAAALAAVAEFLHLSDDAVREAAPKVGADVSFFLTGGTAMMEGYGEKVTRLDRLTGFACAVAVPPFEMSTPRVYRCWDRLGGPIGDEFPSSALPPSLRRQGPFRNDLTPAALSLAPELADWMRDLSGRWGRPVALSGSGPSLFGYFADLDEAQAAANEAPHDARAALASELSPLGVHRER